ncbi:MAG: DUF3224 domain-containing protein [Pyrinomonadaceae bacterium]
MRTISIVVLVITASALALTQVKSKDANQKTQVARERASMRKEAKATFGIKSWDEKPYDEIEGAPKLTRVSATKSYQGDIEGEGKLEYLMMYRSAGSANFMGLERVTGSVGGRSGSFVLQHSGAFEEGVAKVTLSVVPGSGTGALRGMTGEGGFSVGHQPPYAMTLDYHFE